jgi:lipopolysaccharide/colanic/teichoic acid biosynthesis glycosyltransferase
MKVSTPTSDERINPFVRGIDLIAVVVAGPTAAFLRDGDLLTGPHIAAVALFCAIGLGFGLAVLIAFHLGKGLGDHVPLKEAKSVLAASVTMTALTTLAMLCLDRLDAIPRSMPLIHLLVVNALMLGGRVIATRRRPCGALKITGHSFDSQHVLIIGANSIAWSYLKFLDALNVDASNIVGILDDDPHVFGRSLFGQTVIAPSSALHRVVAEYKVHGVDIDRVLITATEPKDPASKWRDIESYCSQNNIAVEFIGDTLGVELQSPASVADSPATPRPPEKRDLDPKRAFDFAISLILACALAPIFLIAALAILIDLGWPVLFWQKRVGFLGRPFLIYKFRTLHAPFDRRGRFVADDRRPSRLGAFLRRTRIDELPQLWNVLVGDMSFVGPRPLLPADQPPGNAYRLQVPPGLTGWAQVHGGRRLSADEKGALDDWYVANASFFLDVKIIARTTVSVIFGDDRGNALSASQRTPAALTRRPQGRSDEGLNPHAPLR